ncbi:Serine/threonine-protein phosphatase PP1-beta [Tritrichomonas foetus]|uniref:Serine/threonine-protein phosphatase n=1 Tax=Tritrichomonas foetus TaxID=1144522 RepID=A0A1J4JAY6_9EUKA|nr:Serine/threonine-protein phosphatase PP1-beta [Tritrichomonas foetus]|eukprot:OHS94420.1 Serine/threonine-protein phosphatase PP1-beta [Tritrichomonas foetus]
MDEDESPCDIVIKAYMPYLTGAHVSEFGTTFPSFGEDLLNQLIEQSKTILRSLPTLVRVSAPALVIGDIHGNVTDLIKIFEKFSDFENTRYVFLGDYVDRGMHSVPVMTLLLAMLCKYPNNITLIRGNHEFSHINQMYGFFEEIMIMYQNMTLWENFQELFAYLPLAAIVNNQIFCVHGGISPMASDYGQIEEISRPIYDYDNNPLIADLVWSDPNEQLTTYAENHRGSGVLFGNEALKTFLMNSNLKLLVRAHQCVADGYSIFGNCMGVTVFSSSDYCHIIHNKCGVMQILTKGKVEFFAFPPGSSFTQQPPKLTMELNIATAQPGMRRSIKKPGIALPTVQAKHRTPRKPSAKPLPVKNRVVTPKKSPKRKITTPHLSPKVALACGRIV